MIKRVIFSALVFLVAFSGFSSETPPNEPAPYTAISNDNPFFYILCVEISIYEGAERKFLEQSNKNIELNEVILLKCLMPNMDELGPFMFYHAQFNGTINGKNKSWDGILKVKDGEVVNAMFNLRRDGKNALPALAGRVRDLSIKIKNTSRGIRRKLIVTTSLGSQSLDPSFSLLYLDKKIFKLKKVVYNQTGDVLFKSR